MEEQVKTEQIQPEDKRFQIQLKKGEQVFIFSVPDGTPYGTAYDACLEILIAINNMINKATESAMPKNPDEVVAEVIDKN